MNGPPLANMKTLRIALGLTQEAFAQSLGVSKTTYNNYETGVREPGHMFLIKVATQYKVTIDYLIGLSNSPKLQYSGAPPVSESEQHLLDNYRSLNEEGQEKLLDYSTDLVASGRYKKREEVELDSKEA